MYTVNNIKIILTFGTLLYVNNIPEGVYLDVSYRHPPIHLNVTSLPTNLQQESYRPLCTSHYKFIKYFSDLILSASDFMFLKNLIGIFFFYESVSNFQYISDLILPPLDFLLNSNPRNRSL